MLNTDFLRLCVEDPFSYKFTQNPSKVPNLDVARASGVNCVSLVYLFARASGYLLPDGALPYELYLDSTHFKDISDLG